MGYIVYLTKDKEPGNLFTSYEKYPVCFRHDRTEAMNINKEFFAVLMARNYNRLMELVKKYHVHVYDYSGSTEGFGVFIDEIDDGTEE